MNFIFWCLAVLFDIALVFVAFFAVIAVFAMFDRRSAEQEALDFVNGGRK